MIDNDKDKKYEELQKMLKEAANPENKELGRATYDNTKNNKYEVLPNYIKVGQEGVKLETLPYIVPKKSNIEVNLYQLAERYKVKHLPINSHSHTLAEIVRIDGKFYMVLSCQKQQCKKHKDSNLSEVKLPVNAVTIILWEKEGLIEASLPEKPTV